MTWRPAGEPEPFDRVSVPPPRDALDRAGDLAWIGVTVGLFVGFLGLRAAVRLGARAGRLARGL